MKMDCVLHKAYFPPEMLFYRVYTDHLVKSLNLNEVLVQGVWGKLHTRQTDTSTHPHHTHMHTVVQRKTLGDAERSRKHSVSC